MLFDNRGREIRVELAGERTFFPAVQAPFGAPEHERINKGSVLNETKRFVEESCLDSTIGEFDPGSGRTLAARLTHASRTGGFGRQWRTGA